jgi:hypothetical protein
VEIYAFSGSTLSANQQAVELMKEGGVESMKDVLKYLGAVGQGL